MAGKRRRRVVDHAAQVIGPRVVDGRYLSGYWNAGYTVLGIVRDEYGATLTVRWDKGNVTVHSTAWDPKRDRVLEQV